MNQEELLELAKELLNNMDSQRVDNIEVSIEADEADKQRVVIDIIRL